MSTSSTLHGRTRRRHIWPSGTVTTLAVLLVLLVIGALQGGIAMVTNPIDPLGMSPDYLLETPVGDYFWPGMFLIVIATASAITVPGLVSDWGWRWVSRIESAIGHRWPCLASIAIGSILLVFELLELVMVPFHPIMHPILIAWSIAIVMLPLTPSARSHLSVR